jgi:hypothetical protein
MPPTWSRYERPSLNPDKERRLSEVSERFQPVRRPLTARRKSAAP